ncbi:DNA methylase [Mycoplasmopsis californica]|uniref:DNA methylase n=1 Tax=Mycoplasmopsis californica TaxID=2113 RepID=A0A059XRZ5_9BACT|nr:16S rRNA (guanine(966)-N(2))-methyltransferase RsmD [Mycoplasmopsis californica]AIA29780.1 DNA methylase [Mycoplasmopsis californica]
MLRIISGKYRRLQILQPRKENTRATKDSIREAIFNTLRFEIEGKIVLDLFAGSGAMGIEAISNGCAKALLVDNDSECFKVISDNLNNLKINNVQIFKDDAIQWLRNMGGRVFDFIFIDPPYRKYNLVNEALNLIVELKYLEKFGTIILETDDITQIVIPKELIISKTKQYGKTTIVYITNVV